MTYARQFLNSKFLLYAAVLVLAVRIITVAFYIPFPNNFFFADITRNDLTSLLNSQRQKLGLNKLTESQKLDQAAALKAQDMVAKGYFAHQSPQGTTPWHWFGQVGYNYKYAGENLAVGFIDSPEVFNAWLNSPSHKANILNSRYTEVGTAVVPGFEGNSIVVVQLFGSPKVVAASTPKTNTLSPKPEPVPEPVPEPGVEPVITAENPDDSQGERVLPAFTQNVTLESPGGNTSNSSYVRWLNFIIYGNGEYLQYIAYLLLAAVALCLFINIMAVESKLHRALVIRSLAIIMILGISIVVDKSFLVHVIPHQLLI